MNEVIEIIKNAYSGYFNYLKNEILHPSWTNYFYVLIGISVLVWSLEILFPWRKDQPLFRKDFWLDTFYMFFNFFILNLIFFIALSETSAFGFSRLLNNFGYTLSDLKLIDANSLPWHTGLLVFFLVTDFVQWGTHWLLHRIAFFWKFHKVHHSVKQMGFAAHLRYHWLEPIVYRTILYIPLAVIGGFSVADVVFVHFMAIIIGHLNHANVGWDYGWLKYIFNNPKMHIWHHTKNIPQRHGANFGISLSIWDYLFKTNFIPFDGRDNELGFPGDENFPHSFLKQGVYPLKR